MFGSQFDHVWITTLNIIPLGKVGQLCNPEPFWIEKIAKLLQKNNHDRLSGRCLVTAVVTVAEINYLAIFGS
jgi:hypothetical protein